MATCPHDHDNHRWHSWKNATTTHMTSGIIVRLTRRPAGPGRNAWCRRSGRRSPRARYPGALRKTRALRCRGRCSLEASRRLPRCCTSRAGRTAHIRSLSPGTAQTWSQVACTAPALPSKTSLELRTFKSPARFAGRRSHRPGRRQCRCCPPAPCRPARGQPCGQSGSSPQNAPWPHRPPPPG